MSSTRYTTAPAPLHLSHSPTAPLRTVILPALLLCATALLYLWDLSINGYANSFYAAAAQAGAQNWEAFFFGSSDAGNSITIDKTPLSIWPSALAIKLFGLSSWAVLLPQAIMGVASVALLWRTVRRVAGDWAGLIAGLTLAITPVAALMFRFNNPDALLVLIMIAAAWAMTRAVEDGRWRWLVLCGSLIGVGFLTKQLQVLLVVPGLALTYLLAGPPRIGTRVLQLLAAGAAMIAASGWYIAIVEWWPADTRPWIGGSQTNSLLELTFGYNGLGRLNGTEVGSVGGTPAGGGGSNPDFGGDTGLARMFATDIGGQIAWLLPAAVVAMIALAVVTARRPRTDPLRAATVLWGSWLVVTAAVFSFMEGIMHQYYTVALAPAIAALVGIGAWLAWRTREQWISRIVTAAVIAGTAIWAVVLLNRSPDFVPWLPWLILSAAAIAAGFVVLGSWQQNTLAIAGISTAIAIFAAPVAYSLDTVSTAHTGSIVTAGPEINSAVEPQGRGRPDGDNGARPGVMDSTLGTTDSAAGAPPVGATTVGGPPVGDPPTGGGPAAGVGRGAGPGGGLLEASTPSEQMQALLVQESEEFTWVAAAIGSQTAAGYQLATELPVMPVGGFNGSDPSPTLEQFQQWVVEGEIHWFISGNQMGPAQGVSHSNSAEISTWVADNFSETVIDGVTLYDLTAPTV